MNLDVTGRAVGVLRVLVMLRTSRLNCPDIMRDAVARQTELVDGAVPQQPRVRGSMRRMTGRAPLGLYRRMFIGKRALLVCVTFNTSRVCSGGQSGLFEFKATMRIMAIATLHGSFENLMVEGLGEIRLCFAMATHAKLRLAHFQYPDR